MRGGGTYLGLLVNLISIVFICSVGVHTAVPFLRMYMMAMCWVTATAFLLANQIGKPIHTHQFYISIFVVTFLGAMTHYYCIVYTVLSSAIYVVALLFQKKWKDAGGLCVVMMMSGIVSIAAFPAMLKHIFFGYRGEEAVENLSSLENYSERIQAFFDFLSQQMFGGVLGAILVFVVLLLVCELILKYFQEPSGQKEQEGVQITDAIKVEVQKMFCVALPSILYFLLISKIAAYVSDRYIFPIYAVCLVWVSALVAMLVRLACSQKVSILSLCIIFSVAISAGWQNYSGEYLYRNTSNLLETAATHADVDCLCIYSSKGRVQPSFEEISRYKSVTFVPMDQVDRLLQLDMVSDQEMVVLLVGIDNEQDYICQIMEMYPQLNSSQSIGSHGYGSSYYLSWEM